MDTIDDGELYSLCLCPGLVLPQRQRVDALEAIVQNDQMPVVVGSGMAHEVVDEGVPSIQPGPLDPLSSVEVALDDIEPVTSRDQVQPEHGTHRSAGLFVRPERTMGGRLPERTGVPHAEYVR